MKRCDICLCLFAGLVMSAGAHLAAAQGMPAPVGHESDSSGERASPLTLFTNVHVFDGVSEARIENASVLIEGNLIRTVSTDPIAVEGATVIDGGGRTLIPGLIDAHWHTMYVGIPIEALVSGDMVEAAARAVPKAEAALMRGFTTVRDMGGPAESLKKIIDAGVIPGPRILPSGPGISQTSGHFDYRDYQAIPASDGDPMAYWYRTRMFGLADGVPEMLKRVRENLRMGASQIKLATGGGVSSVYDPLDVSEYTVEEIRAAVDAAEDWNTYVTVHAYHPRAVRRAIEAGVKCVEHGQLLDEDTLALMAEKGVWLSLQMLMEDSPNMAPERRLKRLPVLQGQQRIWPLAKRLGVKLAWGTDFLFEPGLNPEQNGYLLKLRPWFTPAEILKLATHDNAQLLALSGPRSPYAGTLGVVREGALADLILVDGDPLADLALVADPASNFDLIIKDGTIVKEQP